VTKVTFLADHELPYSVLGKLIDRLRVHKAFEENFESSAKKKFRAEKWRRLTLIESHNFFGVYCKQIYFCLSIYEIPHTLLNTSEPTNTAGVPYYEKIHC
jgi:hypothetical protein